MLISKVVIAGQDASLKDLQVSGAVISAVNAHGEHTYTGDTFLEFESALVFPGLINSHEHLEFSLKTMWIGCRGVY